MHKPFKTFSTWAGAAALTGAMLLAPDAASAQAGGMAKPGQGQPSQQQTNDAQGPQASAAGDQQMEKMEAQARDGAFVSNALAGNLAEAQMGQLALQKSSDPQVKQFAQRMMDDHTKLSDNMRPAAVQLGVRPPTQLDKKDQKMLEKLSSLSGADFDRAYMKEMVKDHKKDLQSFRNAAASAQNPAVKAAADQGIQMINAHLEQAEQIAGQQTASK